MHSFGSPPQGEYCTEQPRWECDARTVADVGEATSTALRHGGAATFRLWAELVLRARVG